MRSVARGGGCNDMYHLLAFLKKKEQADAALGTKNHSVFVVLEKKPIVDRP